MRGCLRPRAAAGGTTPGQSWPPTSAGREAGAEPLDELRRALDVARPAVSIVHAPAQLWRRILDDASLRVRSGLLRVDLPEDRALAALAVIELRERRLPVRVAPRPLGLVASRRAL